MTNEEAIKILESISEDMTKDDTTCVEWSTALLMGVDAIKTSEKLTNALLNNSGYVDELEEHIFKQKQMLAYCNGVVDGLVAEFQKIKESQKAQKPILSPSQEKKYLKTFQCSNCKSTIHDKDANYCFYCGLKLTWDWSELS